MQMNTYMYMGGFKPTNAFKGTTIAFQAFPPRVVRDGPENNYYIDGSNLTKAAVLNQDDFFPLEVC